MVFLLLEMVRRMAPVEAQRHRTDGEAQNRLNDRLPARAAIWCFRSRKAASLAG
jgi:hypothetical protein